MRQLAADVGALETIMFRDGFLTEASASNVLCVIGGTIVAPPKDNLILPGITYDAALEFARDAGLPMEIRPVSRAEALAADELWLSSSTKEVLAITSVDGRPVGDGKPGPGLPQGLADLPGPQGASGLTRAARTASRAGGRHRCRPLVHSSGRVVP